MMVKMKLCYVFGLVAAVNAHIQMSWPPAFRSKFNPYVIDVDYDMTAPLHADGGNYPCKGYHSLMDTPQGKTVVNWRPGQTYNITLAGSATHLGGSCQVSMSFDRGQTWKVLHSYIGKCPLSPTWQFMLPYDTPNGSALFAWSWFNKVGNREMYMNCAHVAIDRGSAVPSGPQADSITERPPMLAANIGNGCSTIEGYDLAFPQPGPALSTLSENTAPPVGSCGRI
ncbi:hypothetical protein NQ176_g426 [Zarea fungicola]|uniref:Uncharacterized protein n=1 Tax=Zarea fungicola TaxID=93591 RepID=A0ACC1NXX5_9HYPO|nr:hypothetical protein NQ176_g426 [Lecanicillium fungicola]